MYVADHNSAVRRNFKSRAMPEKEIPPARLVDIYFHLLKNTLKRDKTFFERVERYGRMFIFNSYLKCKNRKVANATFKRNGS